MIAHNPHHAPAPTSLALACRMAERAAARSMGRQPRPRVVWRGVTYLRCLACKRWQPAENFHRAAGHEKRASYCIPCANAMRVECHRAAAQERTAVNKLALLFERKYIRILKLASAKRKAVLHYVAIKPKVVKATVVVTPPSSTYSAPRPSTRQVAYVPPAPTRHPGADVDRVVTTDGGNPARAGLDALAFEAAAERGRFEHARKYNPLLTWEHWVELTHKQKRGRKPRREAVSQ